MATEVKVPQLGESIVEATVGRWLKQVGERVAAGEALVELETDKVNMDVAAPETGSLASIVKQEGETVGIGDVLGTIGAAVDAAAETPAAQPAEQPAAVAQPAASAASTPDGADEPARSTPLARRIAAEHGVDIGQIKGSGPSGRVTKDDVTAFVQGSQGGTATPERPPAVPAPSAVQVEVETLPGGRREERIRMSRRRLTIARRLVEAQQTAAMLTTFNEADMSAIMELRARRRDAFKERHGVGLGFMSFFTKAVVAALKEYPRLNAEIQGDEMILKYYYDIGIAVGTDEGLVVPVVRDADRLSFAEIEREVSALAAKARSGELSLPDLQGGTFTITNGGIYGSLLSTPILNAPQVGILGMHKIQERPVAVGSAIEIRPMMYLALSYDHRIVDGSEAVRFLVRIKELLEDPGLLLVEG
ncbi:MAG TPA: 2-oxoglutarate dehydrogenase complex dihydrolipoyllysine-residue succinyltransferase [Chloroflexota bacterium]|nr:2-oxoglutarate dehydrogenase complex dihydrolipoyllysine-residue succinyltransferase [Chloroflexota bacterium]